MRRAKPGRFIFFMAALCLVGGCAVSGLRLAGREGLLKEDHVYDLKTGLTIQTGDLVERLASVRVIFIGELHNHPAQHRRQLEIIRGLWKRDPGLIVGLEVFSRPDQDLLDRWVKKEIEESTFVEMVVGEKLGRETFEVYFPLLKWA